MPYIFSAAVAGPTGFTHLDSQRLDPLCTVARAGGSTDHVRTCALCEIKTSAQPAMRRPDSACPQGDRSADTSSAIYGLPLPSTPSSRQLRKSSSHRADKWKGASLLRHLDQGAGWKTADAGARAGAIGHDSRPSLLRSQAQVPSGCAMRFALQAPPQLRCV